MRLARLNIENIRNISSAGIEIDPGINGFYGVNGSGKTSLLEAVYFLGSARTFRSQSADPLISRNEESCTVFGVVEDAEGGHSRVGVSRNRDGKRQIHINGKPEARASSLARTLPSLVVGPDTVELLTGAPQNRRRFLNWGVFHVEPSFAALWEQTNRCLRQRNRLLRDPAGGRSDELDAWTTEWVRHAVRLDELRKRYFDQYREALAEASGQLTGLEAVECRYYRGWDPEQDLDRVVAQQLDSDYRRGYTQSGPQRADIRVRMQGDNVANVCSRGELKILAWAMVLAQGWLLTTGYRAAPLYLVDDLASELDGQHRQAVCDWLARTECQIWATGVDREMLVRSWGNNPLKMFHVEQGQVVMEEMLNER